MTEDRIRIGVINEGGAAPEWYWRQQIEAIEKERDELKDKLAEVVKERDALRVVELPKITEDMIDAFADTSMMELRPNPLPTDGAWVYREWTQDAVDFVALINKERGV